ncbi:MAG: hypothetical protein HON68_06015 [Gammaproteobacteria bacterium]|nr:hypothetical protein [Gammaproteobacteria bacterium]MBT3488993.1 hypothetical protein [Gammaproteobacteria bacterium]MBT3719992.1 hypothetical protein [Gammaproteobacteria bacterium]MBT3844354.1 hypothetical protein [Gammaproteobacteria bacterium]MBT4547875.1 hypothetical protein [Gammaproteobacteria bacterium]
MSFSLLLFVPIALLLYYFIKRQGFEYLSKVWLVGGGIIFYASQNILYLLFFLFLIFLYMDLRTHWVKYRHG